jgi:phosphoserine phosphatase
MSTPHSLALASPLYQQHYSDAQSAKYLQTQLHSTSSISFSFDEHKLNAALTFTHINTATFEQKAQFTVVSQSLNLRTLANVLAYLFPTNVAIHVRANAHAKAFATFAVDVFCEQVCDVSNDEIANVCAQYRVDIFKKLQSRLSEPGLLVMDMDSTVIAMECIDEIADLAGVKGEVSEVTERAMRGEIPFTQSLHDRVACLAGVAESDLLSIREQLPFMPGFMETMHILKQANWHLAIASGGFTFFADYVKGVAQLDAAFSNQLEVKDGILTGKVIGDVVDGAEKARILTHLSKEHGVAQTQCVAIGDGANDLIMMEKAGSSIAYHAKASVAKAADNAIRFCGFEGVLFSLS